MGNRSSWQTVSQNSTGNDDPCFLRVLKRESSALHPTLRERQTTGKYISMLTDVALQDLLRS